MDEALCPRVLEAFPLVWLSRKRCENLDPNPTGDAYHLPMPAYELSGTYPGRML